MVPYHWSSHSKKKLEPWPKSCACSRWVFVSALGTAQQTSVLFSSWMQGKEDAIWNWKTCFSAQALTLTSCMTSVKPSILSGLQGLHSQSESFRITGYTHRKLALISDFVYRAFLELITIFSVFPKHFTFNYSIYLSIHVFCLGPFLQAGNLGSVIFMSSTDQCYIH